MEIILIIIMMIEEAIVESFELYCCNLNSDT